MTHKQHTVQRDPLAPQVNVNMQIRLGDKTQWRITCTVNFVDNTTPIENTMAEETSAPEHEPYLEFSLITVTTYQ